MSYSPSTIHRTWRILGLQSQCSDPFFVDKVRHIKVVLLLVIGAMGVVLSGCGGRFSLSMPETSIMQQPGEISRVLPLSPGHGVAAGAFTLQPGASEELGQVVVLCPRGGSACIVTVATDGTATYDKTGGTPTVLPAEPEGFAALPLQHHLHAAQAPVVDLQGVLHVGADIAPSGDELAVTGTHNGTTVSYGRVRDGVGADAVIAYLNQQVDLMSEHPGFMTFDTPPTVRLIQGTSAALSDYAVRAVQLINAALPRESRLLFSSDPAPTLRDLEAVPDGEIFVDFSPWDTSSGGSSGVTYSLWQGSRRTKAYIFIDPAKTIDRIEHAKDRIEESAERSQGQLRDIQAYYEAYTLSTVVHELIHAIGMNGHADPIRFAESVMSYTDDLLPGHALFPVDREVLLASHSVLEPGASAEQIVEDLGEWDDASIHLRGDFDTVGGEVAFGVASRNGLAQPWVFGAAPWTDLAHNPVLSETVTWSGRLLGFTPAIEAVGGVADLAVELETLGGQLDFSNLEHWGANAPPGPVGSGTTWGDGDLRYRVIVRECQKVWGSAGFVRIYGHMIHRRPTDTAVAIGCLYRDRREGYRHGGRQAVRKRRQCPPRTVDRAGHPRPRHALPDCRQVRRLHRCCPLP